MYEESDEVFPDIRDKHVHYLKSLGMHCSTMSHGMICERAESIEQMQKLNEEKAHNRSECLLKMIGSSIEKGECFREIHKRRLQNIKFLKVLQKSKSLDELPWFGNKNWFGAPNNMFTKEHQDIVSCSSLICQDDIEMRVEELLRLRHPGVEDVMYQCDAVIKLYQRKK